MNNDYVDALDCETVSLEAARLVERENDTVCAAQRAYFDDEDIYNEA